MDPQRARSRAIALRRPTFPVVLGMLVAVIVAVPLPEGLAHLRVGVMLGLAGLTIPILAVAAASDRRGAPSRCPGPVRFISPETARNRASRTFCISATCRC